MPNEHYTASSNRWSRQFHNPAFIKQEKACKHGIAALRITRGVVHPQTLQGGIRRVNSVPAHVQHAIFAYPSV